MIDYINYILFKIAKEILRRLPVSLSLFLGRRLGDVLYYCDYKHRAIAYANIKVALGPAVSPDHLSAICRKSYQHFGQNLIEVFLIPIVDKEYMQRYFQIEGLQHINEAFKKGKGVILLGVHAGSWEFSNVICANLGFPYNLLVRDQNKYPRMEKLLNAYRSQKNCKLIQRQNETRQLIEALKRNEAVGMTVDQGGKSGVLVKFFGQEASMAKGAIRLALKYGCAIVPGFFARMHGPYLKTFFEAPLELIRTGDLDFDIRENLKALIAIYEKYLLSYPHEYFWSYKIWKYSQQKNILILTDGKAGHFRQAQAVAKILTQALNETGKVSNLKVIEVKFRNRILKKALALSSCLAGKYRCQGCLWCLRKFLDGESYNALVAATPDIIISCGSSLAPVNYVLSRENQAKSIVAMRPSLLSMGRFDLVIMPAHDRPPKKKNILVTEGSLNLIDDEYLGEQARLLISSSNMGYRAGNLYIGLLIGGDSKKFILDGKIIREMISQVKNACEELNADILVTTSRRTPKEIEKLIKEELSDYPRSRLLIIANEKNIPEAVGGILGLSNIIVTSPESISMISEAASSGKYVFAFKADGLSRKHLSFIRHFVERQYLYLVNPKDAACAIMDIWRSRPQIHRLRDSQEVRVAIGKLL